MNSNTSRFYDGQALPETLFSSNASSFLKQVKEGNVVPFIHAQVLYKSDIWDLSGYKKDANVSSSRMRFYFQRCPECFVEDLKDFIIVMILEGKAKIQSIYYVFGELCRYFTWLNDKGMSTLQNLSDSFITDYIDWRGENSLRTKEVAVQSLKKFFEYYEVVRGQAIGKTVWNKINKERGYYRANKNFHKTPDIPEEYFTNLMKYIPVLLKDKNILEDIKRTAVMTIIIAQTGLHPAEALALNTGCVNTVMLASGDTANSLTYQTWKRQRRNGETRTCITFMNDVAMMGYKFLEESCADLRKETRTDYLYILEDCNIDYAQLPYEPAIFNYRQRHMYVMLNKYFPTVNLGAIDCENLTTSVIQNGPLNGQLVTYPSNIQYRVHCCSDLYKKGVPLDYIAKFMSHLTEEMKGYYVRPKASMPQENPVFSLKVIQGIVTREEVPLGNSSSLVKSIEEFIEKGHYNISTDLDTVVNELANKIPIRQKSGGVCIKSSLLRECSKDAATNEFFCAYGVCPNIFHFYYMIDLTYTECLDQEKLQLSNKKNGYKKQALKDGLVLQTLAKNKLKLEIDELKRLLYENGEVWVLERHPTLEFIIHNLDEVERRANNWIQQR